MFLEFLPNYVHFIFVFVLNDIHNISEFVSLEARQTTLHSANLDAIERHLYLV